MARNGSVIFYTHATATPHPASRRKTPNRSIPMVSLMGIFPAPSGFNDDLYFFGIDTESLSQALLGLRHGQG